MSNRTVAKQSYCYNIVSFTQTYVYTSAKGNACIHSCFVFIFLKCSLLVERELG
jgi:hypothetical protein